MYRPDCMSPGTVARPRGVEQSHSLSQGCHQNKDVMVDWSQRPQGLVVFLMPTEGTIQGIVLKRPRSR